MRGIKKLIDLGPATIRVDWLDEKTMREELECDEDDGTPEGAWDPERHRIVLLQSLKNKPKRARKILLHELVHAAVDLYYEAE